DCFYKFGTGLDIGVFTPSANGLDGILAVNAVLTLENNSPHSSSFMCPSSVKWEAEYTQETGSTPLWIK
ncbi:MAG TPA: hypothetical protein VFM51_07860, partial [Solirubrobacterales bacterium]|nr:hypothetical protein [Solirubrobacterales bacterium]